MQESYDKRLNLLIHGLEESKKTYWETHESTQETIYEFFRKGLQIKEPRSVVLKLVGGTEPNKFYAGTHQTLP